MPTTYIDLIKAFPLRPLRSDADLDRAIAVINALIDQSTLSNDEHDYLDVLGDLVEKYEEQHYPMPPASDVEVLRCLIDSNRMTQAQLAIETGITESTISAILAGKREMTLRHVKAFARRFKISPAAFIEV